MTKWKVFWRKVYPLEVSGKCRMSSLATAISPYQIFYRSSQATAGEGGGNDDDNEAVKGVTSCNGVDNSDTGTDTPLPAGPVRPELDLDTCGLVTCSHTEPRGTSDP
ncbi:hypothetical protein J6590_073118 [Homalodisca vitripennis]|nr:hypothetical protein J6590_073118 [Homalodisca vitripennis]